MTVTDSVIPTDWHAALKDGPTDLTLLSGLADWFEENDQPDAAECLRWAVGSNRYPYEDSVEAWTWDSVDRLIAGNDGIPDRLLNKRPLINVRKNKDAVWAWERLILKWRNSTPEEREGYWRWAQQNG